MGHEPKCLRKQNSPQSGETFFVIPETKPSYLLSSVREPLILLYLKEKWFIITSGRFMIFNDVCMCYDYPISL